MLRTMILKCRSCCKYYKSFFKKKLSHTCFTIFDLRAMWTYLYMFMWYREDAGEFFTSYDEVCESFDDMAIQENLFRGIYTYGRLGACFVLACSMFAFYMAFLLHRFWEAFCNSAMRNCTFPSARVLMSFTKLNLVQETTRTQEQWPRLPWPLGRGKGKWKARSTPDDCTAQPQERQQHE
jgi:hypothetical protein